MNSASLEALIRDTPGVYFDAEERVLTVPTWNEAIAQTLITLSKRGELTQIRNYLDIYGDLAREISEFSGVRQKMKEQNDTKSTRYYYLNLLDRCYDQMGLAIDQSRNLKSKEKKEVKFPSKKDRKEKDEKEIHDILRSDLTKEQLFETFSDVKGSLIEMIWNPTGSEAFRMMICLRDGKSLIDKKKDKSDYSLSFNELAIATRSQVAVYLLRKFNTLITLGKKIKSREDIIAILDDEIGEAKSMIASKIEQERDFLVYVGLIKTFKKAILRKISSKTIKKMEKLGLNVLETGWRPDLSERNMTFGCFYGADTNLISLSPPPWKRERTQKEFKENFKKDRPSSPSMSLSLRKKDSKSKE